MATVFKRKHNYFINYSVNGERKREKIGPDRKLAERVLNKRLTEIVENRYFDKKKEYQVLFDDFANEFLQTHSLVNKRPRVAKRDAGLIKQLSAHFSGKYLCDITPQSIEQYKTFRIEKVKPATVNRELACLRVMINKAIAWDKAEDKNPFKKVKLFKENNIRERFLEKEEITKLLESCAPHLKPIVITALFTGMRHSEVFNLKWQDIDIHRDIINIPQTKSGKKQEIPMSGIVKKALIGVPKHPGSAYVFCNTDGRPYTNVRKSFDAALKKCGIINFTFHDLRRTFGSQLVMAGVNIKTVQELLRHKDIKTTMRYAHLTPDHKMRAMETLNSQLVPSSSPEASGEESIEIDSFSNSLKQLELKQ